jgi:hypothetical protein
LREYLEFALKISIQKVEIAVFPALGYYPYLYPTGFKVFD